MLELRRADIVITAEAHNPSIISPDWVRKTLAINEEPSEFVHTPPFSLFDSASFFLTVDPTRWRLTTKVLDDEHISVCGIAAGAYVRALPHISYRALGMNYIWAYSVESSEELLPQVELKIGKLDPKKVFDAQGIRYGGTVRVRFKEYLLKVTIDYEGDGFITFNYNFHHDVRGWGIRKIGNATKSFLSLRNRSEELTKLMLAGGRSEL